MTSPVSKHCITATAQALASLPPVSATAIAQALASSSIITCRYCSCGDDLTIDHVIPISRGGKWEWENLVGGSSAPILIYSFFSPKFVRHVHLLVLTESVQVTACARCNSRKGQKTLEQANMKLRKIPRVCHVASLPSSLDPD